MIRLVKFTLLILFVSPCLADDAESSVTVPDFIDEQHEAISETIIDLFDDVDKWVAGADAPQREPAGDVGKFENKVDTFFQDEKFYEESEDAYVRVQLSSFFASKEDEKYRFRVRAQVPMTRTEKRWKLFFEGEKERNGNDVVLPGAQEKDTSPEFGMHYFTPEKFDISSKYSLGISGWHPFVRARYSKVFKPDAWLIEPAQTFKYSSNDKFEEKTDIYFDKQLDETSLFRVQLNRKTEQEEDGMDYFIGFSYYHLFTDKSGLQVSQVFWGNTKYTYIEDSSTSPVTESKEYSGISDYITRINWRRSIWKKWLFLEVQPGVNFHRQYDFEPNYSLTVNLEFYFGKYSGN